MFVSCSEEIAVDRQALEDLEDEICTLAAHINAATARFFALLAEFDTRCGWVDSGARSCAHWLAWRCSLSPGTAREHVRVAHRLCELPRTAAAFARGELSYSQVRAISRVADADREEDLLAFAQDATAAQLERAVRAYRQVCDEEALDAHLRRSFAVTYRDDGTALVRGRLPAEDAALLVQALDAAADDIRQEAWRAARRAAQDEREPAPDDPGTASRADGLVRVCDAFLGGGSGDAARSGGDRHQVVVHVDADALSTAAVGSAAARTELDDGPAVAPAVARRIACDASIVTLVERDGVPLSVGRRTRAIPASIRRALRTRDDGCRFPGCIARRHLDAHHIEHWAHGGETSLENLVHLCRHHHRLVHEGGYVLRADPDGPPGSIVVTTPSGRRLGAAGDRRRGHVEGLERRGLAIDERTAVSRWSGAPLDLALAVDRLVATAPPGAGP